MPVRSGIGWDSHRLVRAEPPRPLILGGVELTSPSLGVIKIPPCDHFDSANGA